MSRLKSRLLVGAALAAASIGLSACGDDDTVAATPTPTPTPTPAARFSEFGATFSSRFNASTTTEAGDAAAGDVQALTLTAEPQAVS